jgi:hypothetical protein
MWLYLKNTQRSERNCRFHWASGFQVEEDNNSRNSGRPPGRSPHFERFTVFLIYRGLLKESNGTQEESVTGDSSADP